MKRTRRHVECCDLCEIQFESSNSFLRHCGSKTHKMKSMLAQSVSIEEIDDEVLDMLLDEEIPTYAGFSNGVMSVTDTIAQPDVYPETHPVPPPNNNENDRESVIHGDGRCDPGNEKCAFFPFPDEKFFLLYCYAHGIMRPKVRARFNCLY